MVEVLAGPLVGDNVIDGADVTVNVETPVAAPVVALVMWPPVADDAGITNDAVKAPATLLVTAVGVVVTTMPS